MTYLRVRNWEDYQNADVFKKSKGRPPWCKLFTRRDLELDEASVEARLLFFELLRVASEYANVMRSDSEWIARETRMPHEAVLKGLPELVKGAWLSETMTPRRSRKIRDTVAKDSRPEVEVEEDKELVSEPTAAPLESQVLVLVTSECPECFCGGGHHTAECSLREVA